MAQTERRHSPHHSCRELRRELNEAQRDTLGELERYGWELKFVRHPLFQPLVPVLYDPDRRGYAILEEDGTLNEHPPFVIRPHHRCGQVAGAIRWHGCCSPSRW